MRILSLLLVLLLSVGCFCVAASADALPSPGVTVKNAAESGRIYLVWEEVEEAVSYKIYRSDSASGSFSSLGSTGSTKFTDTSAVSGKTYYYKVKAIAEESGDNSPYSEAVKGTCRLAQPEIELSATRKGAITISWNAVSKARSYDLYRSAPGEDWLLIHSTEETEYTDSDVETGISYSYKLQAVASRSAANSAFSEEESLVSPLPCPTVRVSTDDATGKVIVSWNPVESATGYTVYRSSSKSGTYKKIGTGNGTTFTDTSAEGGETYYYKLTARNDDSGAVSARSAAVSAVCHLAAPAVTVKNSSAGKIVLSWDEQEGAQSYKVYRAASKTGTYLAVKTTTSEKYTDTSAAAGKVYYYKVMAIAGDSEANSKYSAVVSGASKLARPELTLTNVTSTGKIKASWKTVTGAKSYDLYRSADKETWVHVGNVTGTAYTDPDVVSGTKYYYQVQALAAKSAANSDRSETEAKTCKLPQPALTLKNSAQSGKVILSWSAVEDARGYEVRRAATKSGTYTLLDSVTGTSLTDDSAAGGKTYYYKVRALGEPSAANSAYSSVRSGTRKLDQPTVTLSHSPASGKILVSWDKQEGASSYAVYRSASRSGTFSKVKTTTAQRYTDSTASGGKTYYYKVMAIADNTSANSAFSDVASAVCKVPRPTITLGSVSSTGSVKIRWSSLTGAKSYNLYRSTDKENWKLVKSTTGTSYTTRLSEAGIPYYFRLQAVASKEAANSPFSAEKETIRPLKAPKISASRDKNLGRAKLSWDAVDNAASYAVYRSTSKTGTYSRLGTTEADFFLDTTGAIGTTYYYKVKALAGSDDGNSSYSNCVTGSSQYARELKLSVTLSGGKPQLAWGRLEGAVSYKVYRSLYKNKGFSLLSTRKYLSYPNTSAAEGLTYYYKISALNSSGKVLDTSDVVSITTPLTSKETLRTRYVAVPKIKLHTLPDSASPEEVLRYMDELTLGREIISRDSGSWYRVFFQGELYYLLVKDIDEELAARRSSFVYSGSNAIEKRFLAVATDLAFHQETVYRAGGDGDLTSSGAMGFDCSGMVSYLLNQTMKQFVPVYNVSSSMSSLSATLDLYNTGYTGAFKARRISNVKDLQPGDVLFFRSQLDEEYSTDLGHCAVYLGNDEFIHCTSVWKDSVCIMPLDSHFREDLLEIRRFLPDSVTPANASVQVMKGCYLYEERSADSDVLLTLSRGSTVTLLYSTDSWSYVRTPSGTTGFARTSNLS